MPSWSCIQMEVAEMVRDPLYRGLSKTAWALLLIYIDLEVNQMDLLPDFVGYLLILSAIGNLKGEERDLILLRPLGILLAVWSGVTWAVPPLVLVYPHHPDVPILRLSAGDKPGVHRCQISAGGGGAGREAAPLPKSNYGT